MLEHKGRASQCTNKNTSKASISPFLKGCGGLERGWCLERGCGLERGWCLERGYDSGIQNHHMGKVTFPVSVLFRALLVSILFEQS